MNFEFVDAQLAERGWQQLPGAQDFDDFVNADYQNGDYVVHVSVSPRWISVSFQPATADLRFTLTRTPNPQR